MYCGKCGTKNDDNAKFCANCGEKIHGGKDFTAPVEAPSVKSPKAPRKANHRLIGIIAVALVAAIIVLSAVGLFGGRSAADTADAFLESLNEFDLVKAHELFPKPVQEQLIAQEEVTADEYRQMLTERNNELRQELSILGSEVRWEIGELEDVSEETLASLKEQYQEEIGIDITSAKHLSIKMTINVWGFDQSENMDAILIKYKGAWYLDYDSAGSLL